MKRKIIVSTVLSVGLLALGTGIALLLVKTRPKPPTANTARPPLLVEAVALTPQTVVEPIVGYGTAAADRYARLSVQVAGEIVDLPDYLKSGVAVTRGQVLLRIDDRDYRQNLQRAKASLAEAQAQLEQLEVRQKNLDRLIETAARQVESAEWEFDQVKNLFDRGAAPKREYEQVRFVAEQARLGLQRLENEKALLPSTRDQWTAMCRIRQAEVELAQLNLDRCAMIAPFDGRVDQVSVELGERVQIGTPVLSLLDPNLIEVPIELPVSLRDRVRVGAQARMSLSSVNGNRWTGRVRRISPRASETTRTFELYLEVNNADQPLPLMPGYFVRAVIDGPTLENVLLVPRGAVQQERVFVYDDGQASRREINVERHILDRSIITGLSEGSIVVTSNLDALYEGAPVRLEGSTLEPAARAAAEPRRTPAWPAGRNQKSE